MKEFGLFVCEESEFLPLKEMKDVTLIENKWKEIKL